MDYIKEIDNLLEAGLEQIKKDVSLRNKMYAIYSDLFLNSGCVSKCGSKDELYFTKIKLEGKKKADKYADIANRTLIFRSKGNVFLPKAKCSFNLNLISDEKAIEMLNKGWLSVNAFIKTPEGYYRDENDGVWKKTQEKEDEELKSLVEQCKECRMTDENNKTEEQIIYNPNYTKVTETDTDKPQQKKKSKTRKKNK